MGKRIELKTGVLQANDMMATANRKLFAQRSVLVVNIMSSPGAGKTTILEKTILELKPRMTMAVIEGDLYTDWDARRIESTGVPVYQINTRGGCHLDARMVRDAFERLKLREIDTLFIENVGNLVCPAEFDLGEDFRVVVCTTTEGNDKPWKYPLMFQQARAILLNKMDLLSQTDFNVREFEKALSSINSEAKIFFVSGRTGQGIDEWCRWLEEEVHKKKIACS
ncbi:MAG TPA: hydrogenase nickel incorporation protein HypB [Syntrophothermus lipocalidus]|uniref:Hydrogenase accessory protein HypB n=1 Tax=Syntrophothermus lipocalidus (strain DSM 12680 / TGB-C1) TaxID=643648 RepID=D7CK54_SYNLT|nr:hydrogenase nickel incorporation protein HypB [Syntrophothermus lipocalidus]ADI01168.1 hydrogenase accessory protein HypB [Syntrophothermus lipocalidus DSM 12680]HHV77906.1 hydrogenase nickel incorporation protein HypB [Syntrophothermus lipocalidus]